MARKILQRLLPHPDRIKQHKALQKLGDRIHDPNLWHLNRRSAAAAAAIGLFVAFIPTPGQMLIAATLALYFRANLVISVILVWITNPVTMPPIFYAAYVVGSWLMMDPATLTEVPAFSLSTEWLQAELLKIWKPFLLGSFILGTVSATLGYFLVRSLWRWHAVQNWEARLALRKARKQNPHS
jgi:uncharacterized protein (DUF2062 family)